MRKYNVFCIDDDYPTNVYNEIILSQSNLFESYKIFNNAKEALVALKDSIKGPDFIFVDVSMPKMDGWSFVEALQNSQAENEEKTYFIFMLTTSLSPFDETKSKEYAWIRGVMEKPLTEQKLEQALKQVE